MLLKLNFLLNTTFIPEKYRDRRRGARVTYRKYDAVPRGKYGEVVDMEAEENPLEIEGGSKRS